VKENLLSNIVGTGAIAHGINIGSSANTSSRIEVIDNVVSAPSVPSSDIRGISVDIGNTITFMNISGNEVVHENGDTMTNGIRVENVSATGSLIETLLVTNNITKGIQFGDANVWGIYIDDFYH